MNKQEIVDEICERAYNAWQPTGYQMIFPDVALTPFQTALIDGKDDNELEPWARVTIRTANREQTAFGAGNDARKFSETGVVMIEIYTPTGTGLKQAYQLGEIIKAAYEGISTPNSLWYRSCSVTEGGAEGVWSRLIFTATWENNEYK